MTSAPDTRWLAFNIQRALFTDRRVREAMTLAFDFEWMNKALFYGAYKRADSYFQNTEYAAQRLIPTPTSWSCWRRYKAQLPAEVFNNAYAPPHSDGSGFDRDNLLKAMASCWRRPAGS